jgi:hypothetical protein
MEHIADQSWMKHLYDGRVIERFRHGNVEVVTVEPNRKPGSTDPVAYRMLFFSAAKPGSNEAPSPLYAINLESAMLGGWVLTEQRSDSHRVEARFDEPLSYEAFRDTALALLRHEERSGESPMERP